MECLETYGWRSPPPPLALAKVCSRCGQARIARAEKIPPDSERFIAAHVRGLESMRHAGIMERWSEYHWKLPQGLPERRLAHDRKLHGPGERLEMLSHIGLDRQVVHDGVTWLDKELMRRGSSGLREAGFGLDK